MPDKNENLKPTTGHRALVLALKLAVAAGLVWAMVHFDWLDFDKLRSATARPGLLALAALMMLVALMLTIVRWRALLAVQGISPPTWDVLRLGFIGFFFSNIIPGSVGGDAVKSYYVAREHGKTMEAITSVLVDRYVGLYTFLLTASVAAAACWWSGGYAKVFADSRIVALCWVVAGLAAGMTLFSAAVLSRTARNSPAVNRLLDHLPLKKHIRRLYDAIYLYRDKKRALAFVLAVSVAAQVPMALGTLVLGRCVGDDGLRPAAYFFLAPVGLVVNTIPISPGGLGTGEAAWEVLFKAFDSEAGAEVAALWHALFLGWSLIGMVCYLKGKRAYDAAIRESAAPNTETSDAAVDVH
ncbi:MAG: flippase-like domain-containing protein [Planctomycetes bacterium]|nr:flippase-like domain-containing protein [Planctomycetota bacterium]